MGQDFVGAREPRPGVDPLAVILVVLLMLAVALGVFAVPRLGSALGPGTPSPGPDGSSPPGILAQHPVVEAIDLPDKPAIGEGWSVDASTGVFAGLLVTSCGVLVGVAGPESPVVGYDIATGRTRWSLPVSDTSGAVWDGEPAEYTSTCEMLIGFNRRGDDRTGNFYLVVDLANGSAKVISVYGLAVCQLAGDKWAGCLSFEGDKQTEFTTAVNLDTGESVWKESAPGAWYQYEDSGLVLGGQVWTPGGFRDPASGKVTFGADATRRERGTDSEKREVTYNQVWRPGGYRTDLVVRVAGPGDPADGRCTVQLWDTGRDGPTWPGDGTIDCHSGDIYRWVATPRYLIGEQDNESVTMIAYSLLDGHQLWTVPGFHGFTPWDRGSISYLPGVSESMQVLAAGPEAGGMPRAVRIADGSVMAIPEKGSFAASENMVYFPVCPDDSSPCRLTAYRPDLDKPEATPEKLWSIDVPNYSTPAKIWTFATGGKMYVVVEGATTDVFPLG